MADIVQGFQLLGRFSLIFPFLFVLVVVYALLAKFKILGENAAVHGLVALMMAALFMFSKKAITIINIMAPWFVILFVFVIFILMSFMLFGFQEKDFLAAVKEGSYGSTIAYWIIGIALVITLGAVSSVSFGGGTAPQETGDASSSEAPTPGEVSSAGSGAFWATIFHPKVLGLLLILLISMFTLQKLAAVQ